MREIRVEIYGQSFALAGDLDPDYVRELARLVDSRMRALAEQTESFDTRRLALLAALNLADELLQMKEEVHRLKEKAGQEQSGLPRQVAARLEECARRLDTALHPSEPGKANNA